MTQPKILIIMLGGGASGKTTTTNAFCIGKPDERRTVAAVPTRKGMEEKRIVWTLYENCAVAGNHKSTCDANNGPGATLYAAEQCFKERDIVIIDGRIQTPAWVLYFNEKHWYGADLHIVFLHFDITAEQALHRLQKRRGVTAEEVAYMLGECGEQVRRAAGYAERMPDMTVHPCSLIRISAQWTTDMIVGALDTMVEFILTPYGVSFVEV